MKIKYIKQTSLSQNSYVTIHNLLSLLDIPITKKTIKEQIASEENGNSLEGINNILQFFNFSTLSIEIQSNKLPEIYFPAIAHLHDDNEYFVVLQSIKDNKVYYIDPIIGWTSKKIEEFAQNWSGIVLMAIPQENAGESDYKQKYREDFINQIRFPLVILTLMFFVVLTLFSSPLTSLSIYSLLLVKFVGLGVGVLLLRQEVGHTNSWVDKVCHIHKKTNCNSVLSSKMARIFGLFSMSDLGFIYFLGGFLWLLLGVLWGNSNIHSQLLWAMNLLVIPYTFFSIYYQARVVKQWCVLCLIVQGLFYVEFFLLLTYFSEPFNNLTSLNVPLLLFVFLLPILFLSVFKPLFLTSKSFEQLSLSLKSLQKDSHIFSTLLKKQKIVNIPSEEESLIIGNVQTPIIITMAASVFCQRCELAKEEIINIIKNHPEKVHLRIIFVIDPEDFENIIHQYIYSLYIERGKEVLLEVLEFWHKNKNFEMLKKRFPVKTVKDTEIKLLQDIQIDWIYQHSIKSVPQLFINQYQFPNLYQIKDLNYHIPKIA